MQCETSYLTLVPILKPRLSVHRIRAGYDVMHNPERARGIHSLSGAHVEDIGPAVSATVSVHMLKLQPFAKTFSLAVHLAFEGCRCDTAQILKRQ